MAHHTTPPADWRGPRLIDDKTVAKMWHPIVVVLVDATVVFIWECSLLLVGLLG
jgi:hypothetical protein